jgi:hypothetical protein
MRREGSEPIPVAVGGGSWFLPAGKRELEQATEKFLPLLICVLVGMKDAVPVEVMKLTFADIDMIAAAPRHEAAMVARPPRCADRRTLGALD